MVVRRLHWVPMVEKLISALFRGEELAINWRGPCFAPPESGRLLGSSWSMPFANMRGEAAQLRLTIPIRENLSPCKDPSIRPGCENLSPCCGAFTGSNTGRVECPAVKVNAVPAQRITWAYALNAH